MSGRLGDEEGGRLGDDGGVSSIFDRRDRLSLNSWLQNFVVGIIVIDKRIVGIVCTDFRLRVIGISIRTVIDEMSHANRNGGWCTSIYAGSAASAKRAKPRS